MTANAAIINAKNSAITPKKPSVGSCPLARNTSPMSGFSATASDTESLNEPLASANTNRPIPQPIRLARCCRAANPNGVDSDGAAFALPSRAGSSPAPTSRRPDSR